MKSFRKVIRYIDENLFDLLLYTLIVLNVAPVIAPVLATIGMHAPADVIYSVYSFFCHELDWRSLHLFDYQYAWCVRDTFIWLNMLAAAIVVRNWQIRPFKWYWVIVCTAPIAIDGLVQTVATVFGYAGGDPLYMSTNFMRMLTGSIFGLGTGLWMMSSLRDVTINGTKKDVIDKTILHRKWWRFFLIVLMVNFILYCGLVALWDRTSAKNKPANWLDFAVKAPANPSDWLARCAHCH